MALAVYAPVLLHYTSPGTNFISMKGLDLKSLSLKGLSVKHLSMKCLSMKCHGIKGLALCCWCLCCLHYLWWMVMALVLVPFHSSTCP